MNEKVKILITDDEDEIRSIIRDVIEENFPQEFTIQEAVDGEDALEKLNFQKFHLLITDLKMPKKDGHSLIKMANALNLNRKPDHILVISAFTNDSKKNENVPIEFLAKPFNFEDVIEFIKATIAKK